MKIVAVFQAVESRASNGKAGASSKSGPKKLEDLEAEGKLAMDRLEDIANYMGDYGDIVDDYAVRNFALSRRNVFANPRFALMLCLLFEYWRLAQGGTMDAAPQKRDCADKRLRSQFLLISYALWWNGSAIHASLK